MMMFGYHHSQNVELLDLNLVSLGAGEGSPSSGRSLELRLGGLQAEEVWLVDVKTLTLDMGS